MLESHHRCCVRFPLLYLVANREAAPGATVVERIWTNLESVRCCRRNFSISDLRQRQPMRRRFRRAHRALSFHAADCADRRTYLGCPSVIRTVEDDGVKHIDQVGLNSCIRCECD